MKTEFLQLLTDFSNSHADLEQKQFQYNEFPCVKHQLAASEASNKAQSALLSIFAEIDQDADLIDELGKLRESIDAILAATEEKT